MQLIQNIFDLAK